MCNDELLLKCLNPWGWWSAAGGGLELCCQVGVVFVEPTAGRPGFGGQGDGELAVAALGDACQQPLHGFAEETLFVVLMGLMVGGGHEVAPDPA